MYCLDGGGSCDSYDTSNCQNDKICQPGLGCICGNVEDQPFSTTPTTPSYNGTSTSLSSPQFRGLYCENGEPGYCLFYV